MPAAAALLVLALAGCASGRSHDAAAQSTGSPAMSRPAASATTAADDPCIASRGVLVSSVSELKSALAGARPGDTIRLAPGTYDGHFTAAISGTSAAPITLCGPRNAVLDGGSISSGYTLHLNHAWWWRVEGFTIEGGQKGVMADGSDYDVLSGLFVHSTGDEAIHLREFSSHDVVSHCIVRDTGLLVAFYGEGIYVGSAHKNWCRYTKCQPDASDDDVIEGNDIASTTAENIDIKEGTSGGLITGNHLSGTGMVASAATAWVNVKGNDWTITDNTGVDSIKDGFQVHQVYPGWGIGNVFRRNDAQVNGPGHGFYVQNDRLRTVVACSNRVSGADLGFSTIACTPAG
ncbi:MAG: hypothetical protein ACRDOA_18105 [Streptosporangiaceae bacterium]